MHLSNPKAHHTSLALVFGSLVLVVLGYYAWRFYLERTACFDSAFFSWLMIDAKRPISVLGRIGTWLPQVLPVLLVRMGAGLEVVLRTYSVCLLLFHAFIFAVCAWGLKDRKAVIALPIMLVAGFHYMFYYGVSELYQGMSITLLLWVLVRRALEADGRTASRWLIACVLLNAWGTCYHQLLILPLLFLLVHEGVKGRTWRSRRFLLLGAVLLGTYVVRIALVPASTYEQSRMPTLPDILAYAGHLRSLHSTAYLLVTWGKFKSLLLLMAAGGLGLLLLRRWMQLLWAVVFSIGYMALILIVDRDGMAPTIYENYYPMLGLVWGIVFADLCVDVAVPARIGAVRTAVWVAVLALGLLQVWRGHYRISYKVAYAERVTTFMRAHGIRKATGHLANLPWNYALGHWALSMETALVSAEHGPKAAATLYMMPDTVEQARLARLTDRFLGPDWSPLWFGLKDLDQRYFNFPRPVPYASLNGSLPDSTWAAFPFQAITIEAPQGVVRMAPDRFTVVPVTIINGAAERFPSIMADGDPLRLTYRMLRLDGSLYQDADETTALEVDVPAHDRYTQGFVIERPKDPGAYRVELRLIAHGKPIGPTATIQVHAGRFGF